MEIITLQPLTVELTDFGINEEFLGALWYWKHYKNLWYMKEERLFTVLVVLFENYFVEIYY